ncbi:hypothetical protein [Reichenbachiella ulvae]|uniref:Uncharacterized protein n=1 Tax=Reichenbachiella ulvae TaxID=2980104 RepID=A0ABT3CUE1_9BACT|nr:hypothetical protein [Reichenbachiella ulvae]MCV9387320.1 hypothetical protein [Reichenbachiella ulvae]
MEPHDSSANYTFEPSNGRLLRHSSDPYRFVVQPSAESFELTIIENGKDSTILKFVSPKLPSPKLAVEKFSDSVSLTLTFSDERLKQLLPKDIRYAFRLEDELSKEMTVSMDAFDTMTVKPVRLNYRNEIYDIEVE